MSGVRVAVTGGFLGGKSTLAKALEERGFLYVNYTRHLKVLAVAALAAVGISVSVETIEAHKEQFRPLLIALGTLVGFDQGNYVEQVLHATAEAAGATAGELPENIVFDNVRFLPQMEKLAPFGFRLIRIDTPTETRQQRAASLGLTPEQFEQRSADASETPVPGVPGELRIVVDGPIEDVVERLTLNILEQSRRTLPGFVAVETVGANDEPAPPPDETKPDESAA